ncbi:MAG: hypothetical protein JWL90_2519 [Chthoniobacteraceae bacterium]|nr:hypothetical protein [Chthoniobacteraceae bacterium]
MTDSPNQLWYPVLPRWLPLLRILGIGIAAGAIYRVVSERHWSGGGIMTLYFLFIQPELRPRTPFYWCGVIVHWIFYLFLLVAVAAVLPSLVFHR